MGRSDIDDRAMAFFCVADGPDYVPMAITALCSIKRFHPEAGAFVVARTADAEMRGLMSQHGVEFAPLDLSDVFAPTRGRRRWPSECFWWTAAYRLFADAGYGFSCSVDGDTLAVAPLAPEVALGGDAPLAGVAKRNGRINSGVLFFDNDRMLSAGFYERAVDAYRTVRNCNHRRCAGFCQTMGDQGLLWEIERLHGIRPDRIDNGYNHMLTWDEAVYLDKNPSAPFGIEDSRILHLLFKPWRPPPRYRRRLPVAVDGYRTWWEYARELWPDSRFRASAFGRERPLAATRRPA